MTESFPILYDQMTIILQLQPLSVRLSERKEAHRSFTLARALESGEVPR